MYQSEFCQVEYNETYHVVLVEWKKFCSGEEYQKPLEYALEIIREKQCDYVADTRNGFENIEEDTKWVADYFMPKAASYGCKCIYFIVDEEHSLKEELEGQEKDSRDLLRFRYILGLDELKTEIAKKLFGDWEETLIWSCLQGVMGDIFINSPKNDAAMAMLGDFAFYAGTPCEELVRYKPISCTQDFIIMVPQNEEWAALIEDIYKEKAKKVMRYAFYKDANAFHQENLREAVSHLPEGYELKLLEEKEFLQCKENGWSGDLVSQYADYHTYQQLGLGVVILKDKEVVAGASSYGRYKDGIEIEVDTREDHRRKGLAYVCAAKLMLECMERNLYPSWDAQNLWSVALAEKLGYRFRHEYVAYEVTEY